MSSLFDHHPYFVTAYDFAHCRPLKHSLIRLSSPSRRTIHPQSIEAPSLAEIIDSIQRLQYSTTITDEEGIISDIGLWLQSIEVKFNGKLIEHTTTSQQVNSESRGTSTPDSSTETSSATPELVDGHCDADKSLENNIPLTIHPSDDDGPDVQLLPSLLSSPLSFKKRLGRAHFLIHLSSPLLFDIPTVYHPAINSKSSSSFNSHDHVLHDPDPHCLISFIHFAVLSNRPLLTKFLINECDASIDIPLCILIPHSPSISFNRSDQHIPLKHTDLSGPLLGSWTPLMLSIYKDHVSVVSVLLSRGANPVLRDSNGQCFR